MRLKLTVAYDGSAYKGWQSQPFGTTVQDVMEEALARIAGERVIVHGAGRTDTGVHALGQCAHIEVPERFSAGQWRKVINHNLPPTVRVLRCVRVTGKFHARKSAKGKVYRYVIRNGDTCPPHEADRVWLVPGKIDAGLLREAARIFEGRHDFAAFTANREGQAKTTVRTLSRVSVSAKGGLIAVTLEGDGFLYKMARMLVYAMVRVAQGGEEPEEMRRRLRAKVKPDWKHVAPASGLYLVKVVY